MITFSTKLKLLWTVSYKENILSESIRIQVQLPWSIFLNYFPLSFNQIGHFDPQAILGDIHTYTNGVRVNKISKRIY